uniref:UDP-N-acetylglucosamine 2-epimerase n=1 Tax=Pseudomonas sp. SID14000 TaxID=1986221 RepID=UPI0015ABED76
TWRHEDVLLGGCDAGAHLDRMCGAPYTTRFLGDCLRGRKLVPLERAVPMLTDDPARLAAIVDGLADAGYPVLLLAHPRLVAKCAEHGIKLERPDGSLHVREPLAYPEMVAAVLGSSGVVTDSGGLQKEAFLLGRVYSTLRTETEWVETLEDGWNVL